MSFRDWLQHPTVQDVVLRKALELPGRVLQFAQDRMVTRMVVRSDDTAYEWLLEWFASHPDTQDGRNLRLTTRERRREDAHVRIVLGPGYGDHFVLSGQVWLWITLHEPTTSGGYRGSPTEVLELRFLRGNRADVEALVLSAREQFELERQGLMRLYTYSYDDWDVSAYRRPRTLDSVVLPDTLRNTLVADAEEFVARRDWYESLGVPYRRGYLLYGPPGNGKSSLAFALAGHLRRNLYLMSLTDHNLTDEKLRDMMSSLSDEAVVLLEDVDAIFVGREAQAEGHMSFSGLLNALDGVAAAEGRILIMTTNHPEQLDPALIRPGRVDLQLEIGNASVAQAKQLYERFFPGQDGSLFGAWAGDGTKSMATLQEHLIALQRAAST